MKANSCSAYNVIHVMFFPVKGVIPQRDARKLGYIGRAFREKYITRPFGGESAKDRAQSFVDSLRGSLSKSYEVLVITDKQFGMQPPVAGATLFLTPKERAMAVATAMQKQAMVTI